MSSAWYLLGEVRLTLTACLIQVTNMGDTLVCL